MLTPPVLTPPVLTPPALTPPALTPPALTPGTHVRVRDDWPEARGPCHVRTPHYVRGHAGTVVRHLGAFPNPEDLAFARPAAHLALYHVAFRPADLWPGAGGDELVLELFEPWLEVLP